MCHFDRAKRNDGGVQVSQQKKAFSVCCILPPLEKPNRINFVEPAYATHKTTIWG